MQVHIDSPIATDAIQPHAHVIEAVDEVKLMNKTLNLISRNSKEFPTSKATAHKAEHTF